MRLQYDYRQRGGAGDPGAEFTQAKTHLKDLLATHDGSGLDADWKTDPATLGIVAEATAEYWLKAQALPAGWNADGWTADQRQNYAFEMAKKIQGLVKTVDQALDRSAGITKALEAQLQALGMAMYLAGPLSEAQALAAQYQAEGVATSPPVYPPILPEGGPPPPPPPPTKTAPTTPTAVTPAASVDPVQQAEVVRSQRHIQQLVMAPTTSPSTPPPPAVANIVSVVRGLSRRGNLSGQTVYFGEVMVQIP